MKGPESTFYQSQLKPFFGSLGFSSTRIESEGIPDIYLTRNNISLWCEVKVSKDKNLKINEQIGPDWRPGQLSWIHKQETFGTENVFLAWKYGEYILFLKPKKLYNQEELWRNRMTESNNYLCLLMKKGGLYLPTNWRV